MLHFGELDAHIPMSDVETIKSKQPSVEVLHYNAGHGFQCDERDSFAPKQLKSLGAAPCASSTATCKMIVSDTARNERRERPKPGSYAANDIGSAQEWSAPP